MNMINKNDIIIFKKDFQINPLVIEFEFISDDYLNYYSTGDKALVIVRLFNTVEVKLLTGRLITIPIDNNLYEVYPCVKSLQILQGYFDDRGDRDKYDLVSTEVLMMILNDALESYEQYDEIDDDTEDFYYTKRNLIKIATSTLGTSCEKRGREVLQMIPV